MSIVQKWLSERGDWTYRLNYDLNKDSIEAIKYSPV